MTDALDEAALARKRTAHDGKPWPDLDFDDIVLINARAPEEVRGKTGYVIGWAPESDPPDAGIFVFELEEVWQLQPDMVERTGQKRLQD